VIPLLEPPAQPAGLLPEIAADTHARARWLRIEAARRARYERDRAAWIEQPPPDLELPIAEPRMGSPEHEEWMIAWEKRRAWAKRGARLMAPLRPRPFQLPIPGADYEDPPPPPPANETGSETSPPKSNPLAKLLKGPWRRGQKWLPHVPRTLVEKQKPKSIGTPPLRPEEKLAAEELRPIKRLLVYRPKFREECRNGPRPCPFVGCRRHLYLDVNPKNGSIKYNFPGYELEDLEETCASDVEERGGVALQRVGEYMGVTMERIRQIEQTALRKLKAIHDGETFDGTGYNDEFEEDPEEDDVGVIEDTDEQEREDNDGSGW